MRRLLMACLAATALGLGCGSDDKDTGGGACSLEEDLDNLKVTVVTKRDQSAAICPDITPEELNAPDGEEEDAGADTCTETVNESACMATVDCPDDGFSFTLARDGDGFKGAVTVMVGSVTCVYDITWEK